ncbi:MAG: hypothetical protein IPN21_17690 [Burkholderiales bacterium]|nr:hypothetical protein [Burkholderiales bacterium]
MDKASLETEADTAHAEPGQTIVTFCNAGHWSATDWFVRSELLGQPDVEAVSGLGHRLEPGAGAPARGQRAGPARQVARHTIDLGAAQPEVEDAMDTLAASARSAAPS